eukprot:g64817.t1
MSEDSDQELASKKAKASQEDYSDDGFSEEEWDLLSQRVLKLDQDVQNPNDRFHREISPMLGKVMETEIPKIMDKAVVHSVSEGSSQEVVDKYLSSLANKLQTVVGPVFEDIVRKSLQTAINTAVEDAVKRQHQQEIEAQRGRLLKEGYDNAVAEKFNMENVADYFVKAWIREYLDIMNKGFQVVVDTLLAQSKQSKRMEGEFVYKEKEPPKVLSSGKGKATRQNKQ